MSTQSPTPPRTPLGPARAMPLPTSRSNGTLARQFVDRHSTTYAHLYEHEDEAIRREKLEAEQRKLEEERRKGREMRERMSRTGGEKENDPIQAVIGMGRPSQGRGSWRPLSLVAKRQNVGLGHARSASHQIPSNLLPSSPLRSVSHTPAQSSSLARETPSPVGQQLEVVVERSRPNSPDPPHSISEETHESHEGDISHSSEPKSTYSWATSFSGETAELRATASYLRDSLDAQASAAHPAKVDDNEEEVLDTPEKVKRRRKRIVAIAHTVRQLEGVGSREAEDPNFYGELVKAWNDRPGFKPVPPPSALTDAPPALLPPPNLVSAGPDQGYGRYSQLAPAAPPAMSPAFEGHFGSPATPHLFTPGTTYDYGGASSSNFSPPHEVYEYDTESEASGDLRSRSFRYSYASALHDLALEGGEEGKAKGMTEKAWLKSPMRWSGAWEGWGARPAPPPAAGPVQDEEQTIDWSRHQQLQAAQPTSIPENPYPPPTVPLPTPPQSGASPDRDQPGWGLGFMSAWWADRPVSSRNLAEAATPPQEDFHAGECEATRSIPISHSPPRQTSLRSIRTSGSGGGVGEDGTGEGSTPGHHHHDTSFNTNSDTLSGISTPSFGTRVHASAERRWARPTMVHTAQSHPPHPPAQPNPSWLVSIPMETSASADSALRPDMPTADSASSNLTSTTRGAGEEREFPFSSHCRPPSCTIPSSTDSSVSVPSEIHQLRAEVARAREEDEQEWMVEREGESRSSGGLANGSFPSSRTLRPMMLRQAEEMTARQSLLERRHVRPLMLGEMLNPVSTELHTGQQSSTFHLDTHMTSPNLSFAPTPTSIQTHFIPPPTTPVLPLTPTTPSDTSMTSDTSQPVVYRTRDDFRAGHPRRSIYPSLTPHPDQSSDPSSSPCDSNGPDGDILPVRPEGLARTGMLDLRGQSQACQSTGREAEQGGYRDATPSVMTAVQEPKRRGVSPLLLFWLGFIMPWCWIFGGWPVGRGSGVTVVDEEKGGEAAVQKGWLSSWIYHPDPWARRCRVAAVGVLPLVAVAGVVGVIVLGVMRGS